MGVGGGGGEYVPQIGFGWTNGVALVLLQQLYAPAARSSSDSGLSEPEMLVVIFISVFVFLGIVALCLMHFLMPKKATSGTTSTTTPSVSMSNNPIHSTAV